MKIGEIYKPLVELIKEDPKVLNRPFYAMGTDSTLRIFRKGPNGPVTSLGLEDSSYMEGYISEAENILEDMGIKNFPERYMQALVEVCEKEVSEEEKRAFINNSLSEIENDMKCSEGVQNPTNVKQVSIDFMAPAGFEGEELVKNIFESLGFEVLGTNQIDLTESLDFKNMQQGLESTLDQKIMKANNEKKDKTNKLINNELSK